MFKPRPIAPAVGRTGAHYKQMIKVGLTHEQAQFLVETATFTAADPFKKHLGFSKRQGRVLKAGAFTMKDLLRGGFTRPQAVVIRRMLGL